MNLSVVRMRSAAGQASGLLKALANRTRLLIVCRLAERERSVGELAAFLGARGSTVSQHLALLRRNRLIASRRIGRTIRYSLVSEPARALVTSLYAGSCAGAKWGATRVGGGLKGSRRGSP